MAFSVITLGLVILCIATLGVITNILSLGLKLCKVFENPKLWRYSLLYQDAAHIILGSGLIVFSAYTQLDIKELCDSTGFLTVFGLFLCFFSFLTTAVIVLAIQNPGKSSSLSSFHRNVVIVVITPEVIVGGVLSFIPNVATTLFDTSTPYRIHCLPIPTPGQQGSAYGAVLTALWWLILTAASVCDVISSLKLWKFYNRVNAAQDNVWQTQLVNQGKTLLKLLLIEHIIWILSLGLLTVVAYVESSLLDDDASWIVMTTLAVSTVLHGVFSNVGNTMWSSCCCRTSNAVQEPHRKLKKLELIKIEAKGKLRMKTTWSIGKGATKKGMLKVYGVNHLKSWAQEIVMLGMLRRAQHPSLIQCLWTNSSNPYYETMTLISGEIITSDSRIICLELTNGGTLQTFLQKVELPLPEPCQRMIIHDVAEGLFYLHHENILHNNLTTSCIYLKGSLQSMVLRAAIGDFEDAQIYGSLQQSFDESIRDKRYFFLPDIRSFALVALEIVSKMCEKKFQNRYVSYDSEHVPLKLNLTNCISDEEDEFGAQYGYEMEDTHRMYGSIQPEEMYYQERHDSCMSPDYTMKNRNDSLENLMDKNRPMSPTYNMPNRQSTPDTVCSDSEGEEREMSKFTVEQRVCGPGQPLPSNVNKSSRDNSAKHDSERTLNSNRVMSPIGKVSHRKSRKDMSKASERMPIPNRAKSPQRSLSPSMYDKSRCVSPDPMKDAKLQELRKETESGKKSTKKERKSSFSRKQKSEKPDEGQAFEAFVDDSGTKPSKRKDGSWLTKPTSILKSITNNETAVSVFKAKPIDEENHLDAIEEEDIESSQNNFNQSKTFKTKEKVKAEVWDIIDEQFYHQCNKKATHNLKKTVSGESRSSLWSFISTPENWEDDEELSNILDCLPGMTEPSELRRSAITVEEIMKEQEKAMQKKNGTKKFSLADLNKSKFELIDYYEMLKAKQITIDQVPEDKREMLMNVVEFKLEEKLKRDGKFKDNGIIRNDELYSNAMAPGGAGHDTNSGPVTVVSFRRNQQSNSATVSSSVQQMRDQCPGRARSAPLKRPRTPMKKSESKSPQVNPAFTESQNIVKRNKARSALRKALNNKNNFNGVPKQVRTPVGERQDLTVKYANVKKINVESQGKKESMDFCQSNESEVLKVPVPTKESFSITKVKPAAVSVKRYSSFSSNESSSSYLYNDSSRKTDVSLTSGELTSVSSQSESDQFETDGHMTDVERQSANNFNARRKMLNRGPGSRVDSGFDSGSMSSEMSGPLHSNQYFSHAQNSKPNLNSWARNYKSMEFIPNSPLDISSKFLSSATSLPEEKFSEQFAYLERPSSAVRNAFSYSVSTNGQTKQFNESAVEVGLPKHISSQIRSNMNEMSSGSSINSDVTPTQRVISVTSSQNKGTLNLNQRPMSPEIPVSQRPMSPERPMSPNVRPTEHRPILKAKARVLSPDRGQSINRPMSAASNHGSDNRPFSPNGRSDRRPFSPSARRNSSERPFSPTGRQMSNDGHSARNSSLSPAGRVTSPSSSKTQYFTNRNTKSHSPIVQINSKPLVTNKGSENTDQTSAATKRYRELVKQGVPLRSSAIESSPNRKESDRSATKQMSRPNTAESTVEEPVDNETLFEDLESKGFFVNRSRSPSPSKGTSPSRSKTSRDGSKKHEHDRHKKGNKHLPLDQIVREVPDQTNRSRSKPFRSQSNNHLIVSEDTLLNQPTSEDSETCSIKTTKSSGSTPSGSRPKIVVDAELVIDRIFSQNHPDDNELDVEVEAALGLDKDPFRTMNTLYSNDGGPSAADLANMPLLNGVNQNHIHECVELVSDLHVVTVRDLLPARQESFDVLRKKLHQVGQLGTVGNQLLDIINKCWLQDMPPTSGDLVEQLTDPVTETEV